MNVSHLQRSPPEAILLQRYLSGPPLTFPNLLKILFRRPETLKTINLAEYHLRQFLYPVRAALKINSYRVSLHRKTLRGTPNANSVGTTEGVTNDFAQFDAQHLGHRIQVILRLATPFQWPREDQAIAALWFQTPPDRLKGEVT